MKKIGRQVHIDNYEQNRLSEKKIMIKKWQYIDDNPRIWCVRQGITKVDIYEDN